jgi:hypothetical protein
MHSVSFNFASCKTGGDGTITLQPTPMPYIIAEFCRVAFGWHCARIYVAHSLTLGVHVGGWVGYLESVKRDITALVLE